MKSTLGIVGVMLVALCKCQLNDDDAKVHLALGWVEGEFRQNLLPEHSPYYAFHAIPYAEPPVGELRFKKPKNYTKSYGTFEDPYPAKDTDTNNKICPQLKNLFTDFAEDEDCLHLSVYSHDIHSSVNGSLLPVLVWIHGGDFESGSGMHRYFGPERFMKDQDIVMVSINYRLGTLGFLSLGNEELPGNAGLWDQVEALKWIQANIHSFGGNPGKVTIMGESAGSWSVMYQVLSPKSATLFQRVIAQSGTPMSPAYHEYAEDKAIE
jgi:carboxylesterase type B